MGRKLLRFMTILGALAVLFGMWLLSYGVGMNAARMQAKLLRVLLLIGCDAWCGAPYLQFASGQKTRSHVWFRWFNEAPVLLLTAIVVLVIVKPF